jgi:hypothetical protein
MMDMTLQNIDIPAIKVLRLLRTLRPLRVISTNVAMKLIVAALFESVGAIANVVVVVVAVWTMFAIFGMNLQKVYRNTFAASPIILQSYPVLQGLLMTTN